MLRRDAGEGNVIDEGSCLLGFERFWSAGIEYGCFEEWEGRYERCATGCLAWKGVFLLCGDSMEVLISVSLGSSREVQNLRIILF